MFAIFGAFGVAAEGLSECHVGWYQFYRERVDQHLRIGMHAIDILRNAGVQRLHSRKLRSFAEVAFQ